MNLAWGLSLVLVAGLLQGTFILPMTFVRRWNWEHTWATFSLLGMLFFNWIITLTLTPQILDVYRHSPTSDLIILGFFGAGWGVGAILFGLGMERLGMALGYPIIMGLIASLGALLPLLIFFADSLFSLKGLILVGGTGLVLIGIVLCSAADRRRTGSNGKSKEGALGGGLTIAISAGILSCLPNLAVAYSGRVTRAAIALGLSETASGNTVWPLLFTFGGIVNVAYCLHLTMRRRTFAQYWGSHAARNIARSAAMAAMWIASFYLYGPGTAYLGPWGVIVGWPLFISLSILMGNVWGIWRGEWKGSPAKARLLLNQALLMLIAGVITVALSNRY
jgi:L-rhamnose-H+ transport protein